MGLRVLLIFSSREANLKGDWKITRHLTCLDSSPLAAPYTSRMNVDVHAYTPLSVVGGPDRPAERAVEEAETLLLRAACVGDVQAIHHIMSVGYCDVDQSDKNGRNALHWAVARGHLQVAEVLVTTYHASLDIVTHDSESPLMLAVLTNRLDIVKTLVSYGAQLQHTNQQGASALHLAAGLGQVDLVAELIGQGAWAELEDNEGESPLFYAIRESHLPVVELLLQHGASAVHPNNDGETPLSLAQECSNNDQISAAMVQLLQEHANVQPARRQNLLEPFTRVESRSFGSSSGNLCGFLTKTI